MSTVARLTMDEYDRLIASGAFDGRTQRRIELIHGELRDMSPIGAPHEFSVDRAAAWSFRVAPPEKVIVRIQNSVGLVSLASVPQPDVAWVALRDYSKRRPTAKDVLLLIEASDSSLAFDRGEKADIYATARISDYWVINLPDRQIEVFRQPSRGRYRDVQVFRGGQKIPLLAFLRIALPASLVFPA